MFNKWMEKVSAMRGKEFISDLILTLPFLGGGVGKGRMGNKGLITILFPPYPKWEVVLAKDGRTIDG
jgi:hypothetical protein